MSRDKQIEEMAKLLHLNYDMPLEFTEGLAEFLIEEGYRKASEVAREIFADFQSILFSFMYFGNDAKYHLRKMSADKVTSIFEKYFELKKKYTESEKDNG